MVLLALFSTVFPVRDILYLTTKTDTMMAATSSKRKRTRLMAMVTLCCCCCGVSGGLVLVGSFSLLLANVVDIVARVEPITFC